MPFAIVLSPEAIEDMKRLTARDRSIVQEAVELHLRHEPMRTSRSRIKRLRGLIRPAYRLRVGELRVYYSADENDGVLIHCVVPKAFQDDWLAMHGIPEVEEIQDENSFDE